VIEIKTGFDPEAVLEQLYRYTPLEDSFSINNVALVDGGPQTLGLREMLSVYVTHRKSVVQRRSQFRLAKRQDRLHLVDGLLIAIMDIDEVIQLIRQSDDTEQARQRLIEVFELSTAQADYILELRLRRLTKFSRVELEAEADELRKEIAALEAILASEQKLIDVVITELSETAKTLGTPRRTVLSTSTIAPATTSARAASREPEALQLEDTPCRVLLSSTGKLVRVDLSSNDESISQGTHRTANDGIRSDVLTSRRGVIGAVTNTGRLIHFSPVSLPGVPASSVSLAAAVTSSDYIELETHEHVVGLVPLGTTDIFALGTTEGVVKRIQAEAFPAKSGNAIISLKETDHVVGICVAPEAADLVFVTSDAQLLRFTAENVRPQGASAGGMAGIRVSDNAQVIYFTAIQTENAHVVTVSASSNTLLGTDAGRAKTSLLSDFPSKGRGTGGVRAQTLLKGEDSLAIAWVGAGTPRASSLDGMPRELPTEVAKRDASGTLLEADISYIGAAVNG
jgi:DNA gyrase subunit A